MYLSKGEGLTTAEVRVSILQQRLNLLLHDGYELSCDSLLFFFSILAQNIEPVRSSFGEPSVHEEVDAGPSEGCGGAVVGGWEKMGRVSIGEELAHNGRLSDDFIFDNAIGVFDRWNQTTLPLRKLRTSYCDLR